MKKRESQKKIPLSEASKKAGVKWMMVDGVHTAKEARRLEKVFLEHQEKMEKGYFTFNPKTHSYTIWTDKEIEEHEKAKG